jgi:peroxiredoxin
VLTVKLNDQLASVREEFAKNVPQETRDEIGKSIAELQSSGIASGVPVGKQVRDFKLKDAMGQDVILYEELARGPVILVFYRGAWCPYCNLQLKAYQKVLPQIHELGARLIAVSPQTPDYSLTMKEKHELAFHVLSDTKGIVAAKYNVLYEVPENIKKIYEKLGINLSEYNGSGAWILPVPAVFMIDETGIVRFSRVDPDFTNRMEPDDIIEALKLI